MGEEMRKIFCINNFLPREKNVGLWTPRVALNR